MYFYRLVLALLIAGYLFLPWLIFNQGAASWFLPYIFWGVLIAVNFWLGSKYQQPTAQ